MKKIILFTISVFLLSFFLVSATDFFITDREYRKEVKKQFKIRKELAAGRYDKTFKIFERDLSIRERGALEYLYAFMPLSDLADYTGEFFLDAVRISLKAREEMPWGTKIPENIYRHFVLPVRVNNENLDRFREKMYREIKYRIKGLSLKEAVLEINHWCHEKVEYRGTDIRTSSPMNVVKSAFGRCGEESTFTVSALRTVAIPARQCYTPRWAHTDDNHAWVEVWINGKWFYLGACEPEPDLNITWFDENAKRTMLVHTKAFGKYKGIEKTLRKNNRFAELNLLDHYTKTSILKVKVLNTNLEPVKNAAVRFLLYNYSEFYPLAEKYTNNYGITSFETGYGDLLIWANKNNTFGFKKASLNSGNLFEIILDKKGTEEYTRDIDLVPPRKDPAQETARKKDPLNEKRLKEEDRIRAEYISTFKKKKDAFLLAGKLNLEKNQVWKIIEKSRGNWSEIEHFLLSVKISDINSALVFLNTISEKDLRDTSAETLKSHFENGKNYRSDFNYKKDLHIPYVLNPRIDTELIKPYRNKIRNNFTPDFINMLIKQPLLIGKWIKENIRVKSEENYYETPITPAGVLELKVTDIRSKYIFAVAICRSIGIPARLQPGTKIPEYYSRNQWNPVFPHEKKENTGSGTVRLMKTDPVKNPEYYKNFTLAKLTDGFYKTLEYEYGKKPDSFDKKLKLKTGHYLLVTGNRQKNGKILTRLRFFNLKNGDKIDIPITIRKNKKIIKKDIK